MLIAQVEKFLNYCYYSYNCYNNFDMRLLLCQVFYLQILNHALSSTFLNLIVEKSTTLTKSEEAPASVVGKVDNCQAGAFASLCHDSLLQRWLMSVSFVFPGSSVGTQKTVEAETPTSRTGKFDLHTLHRRYCRSLIPPRPHGADSNTASGGSNANSSETRYCATIPAAGWELVTIRNNQKGWKPKTT